MFLANPEIPVVSQSVRLMFKNSEKRGFTPSAAALSILKSLKLQNKFICQRLSSMNFGLREAELDDIVLNGSSELLSNP
jgi:hypothetical protein